MEPVEYYWTVTNDAAVKNYVSAAQLHCQICSRQQGGQASVFSKVMKKNEQLNNGE